MGETKFYSLDKAQETMSDFEYFDTLNNERMKKLSDAADAFLLDMKLNDTISRYMNLPKSKDYCIVERKGYLF